MDPAENARKKGVSSYDPPIQSRMGGSVTATPPSLSFVSIEFYQIYDI